MPILINSFADQQSTANARENSDPTAVCDQCQPNSALVGAQVQFMLDGQPPSRFRGIAIPTDLPC